MTITFGREICGDLSTAESREWVVTNGIGGYACGTIAGLLTRRYHGLLVAALKPPSGRMLMLTKLDETVHYNNRVCPLYANRWTDDIVNPYGYQQIEQFRLEGSIPTWTFACADSLLEKQIWMQPGENTTYVRYSLIRATQPVKLKIKALVNYRDHHSSTQSKNWQMEIEPVKNGVSVAAFPRATPLYLLADKGNVTPVHNWYYGFELTQERDRGLDDREDHLHAATIEISLEPGESFSVVASTQPNPTLDGKAALETRHHYDQDLLHRWEAAQPAIAPKTPNWVQHLVLAADQFIVTHSLSNELPNKAPSPSPAIATTGTSVLAGYPWFGEWGRHALVSLPGLTLTTGRPDVARSILRTFAHYLDQGTIPNFFSDLVEMPAYNTIDATLWYFEAVRAYFAATQDESLVKELFPALADVISWHQNGTRYNIYLDASDGLLYGGEVGMQLTWMDSKISESVVTPRIGKPVEVNALWYNALRIIEQFAQQLGKPHEDYRQMAEDAAAGFNRFWNAKAGYCYDVLDGPGGHDASLRPNQIFAIALPNYTKDQHVAPLLTSDQRRSVVDVCSQMLLTSHGLRSLAADHLNYKGHYEGDQVQRDMCYHQGTVWSWLLGPFVQAHLKVYNNRAIARTFLEPMANHLQAHGVGSLSEIFDGDAPMQARGAFAQSWTVAEVLRAWVLIHS